MKRKYQKDSILPGSIPEIIGSISGDIQLLQETRDSEC
jgi:hypothetical protein